MTFRSLVAFAALAILPAETCAIDLQGLTATFVPAHPASGEIIRIISTGPYVCASFTPAAADIDIDNRTILIGMQFDDGLPPVCPPYRTLPHTFEFGPLPRGTFTVQFELCGDPPPPTPPCAIIASQPLIVGGGDPVAVSSSGPASAGLLGAAVLLPGLLYMRLRRRRAR